MARSRVFNFVCNEQERQMIDRLSEHYQRSGGEAIRFLIQREVWKLDTAEQQPAQKVEYEPAS